MARYTDGENFSADVSAEIEAVVREINNKITHGMRSRGYRASNELRNASQLVLRGGRSGRSYIVPGTGRVKYNRRNKTATITYKRYTASAPGEPPAVRTGAFRASWQTKTESTGSGDSLSVRSSIESRARTDNGRYVLGGLLEDGTSRMAPRPYKEKIQQKALPKIKKIYQEPYM